MIQRQQKNTNNYTEEEYKNINAMATKIINAFWKYGDRGRLLFLLVKRISAITRLAAYRNDYNFVVISKNEYEKLRKKE